MDPKIEELLDLAWSLICNASNTPIGEDPVNATPGWGDAATRYRKLYFEYLDKLAYPGKRIMDGGEPGTLVRCEHCQSKDGLLFKPDNMPASVAPEDGESKDE